MKKENVVVIRKQFNNVAEINKLGKLTKNEKIQFTSEMERYAQRFLKDNFDLNLGIPINIDGRLTRTGGSFHFMRNMRQATQIKMSERFIYGALQDDAEGVEAILDVLRHELVHYALFKKGSNEFSDGQPEFERTLKELNIGASGATNEKKVMSLKENVWYRIYDEYSGFDGKIRLYNHTKKAQSWIGKRVGYRIVKSYF